MKDKTFRYVGWAVVVVFTVVCWWFMLRPAFASSPISFGFRVTTTHPTNVVVRYKLRCHNDQHSRYTAERFEAVTPFTSTVTQNMAHPDACHLRVVAWDEKPFATPKHPQPPMVETWEIL